jgi:hypothetical protein
MQAFKNDNIKDKLCGGCDCTGFEPGATFEYDADAGTIVVTDTTSYGSGVDRKIVHVGVYDRNGEKALNSIAAADGDDAITIDVSDLDASGGFKIMVTVVSDSGCLSDGHAEAVGISITAGDVGYWDKDNDRQTIGTVETGS